MPLDPNIILQAGRGVTPLKDPNEIAAEQAQRQMQQLQLQQTQQGMADDAAYRDVLKNTPAGGDLAGALRQKGLGKQAQQAQQAQLDQQKAQGERGKLAAEGMKTGARAILANPTEQNAIRVLEMTAQQYGLPPQMVDGAKAQIYEAGNNPQKIAQLANGWGADVEQVMGKITTQDLGGVVQNQRTNPVTGAVEVFGSQNKTQSPDSLASTAQSAANAKLTDQRAREFNETKVEENKLKREQKQETADLTKAGQVASFDTMLGTLDRLSAHPGLKNSVGLRGKLPTIPGSDSANFQAELDTFQSQAFIPMVAQLKGMGALSDAEGKRLTQAVGALNPNMGEEAFRASIKRIQDDMNAARARVVGGKAAANTGGATGSWGEAPAGQKPKQRSVNVQGKDYMAELADDGKYYVQRDGKWFEVR